MVLDGNRRTVAEALNNRRWVVDIKGALTVQVLEVYLNIWDLVEVWPCSRWYLISLDGS
jgi:hypothetical protein